MKISNQTGPITRHDKGYSKRIRIGLKRSRKALRGKEVCMHAEAYVSPTQRSLPSSRSSSSSSRADKFVAVSWLNNTHRVSARMGSYHRKSDATR